MSTRSSGQSRRPDANRRDAVDADDLSDAALVCARELKSGHGLDRKSSPIELNKLEGIDDFELATRVEHPQRKVAALIRLSAATPFSVSSTANRHTIKRVGRRSAA